MACICCVTTLIPVINKKSDGVMEMHLMDCQRMNERLNVEGREELGKCDAAETTRAGREGGKADML